MNLSTSTPETPADWLPHPAKSLPRDPSNHGCLTGLPNSDVCSPDRPWEGPPEAAEVLLSAGPFVPPLRPGSGRMTMDAIPGTSSWSGEEPSSNSPYSVEEPACPLANCRPSDIHGMTEGAQLAPPALRLGRRPYYCGGSRRTAPPLWPNVNLSTDIRGTLLWQSVPFWAHQVRRPHCFPPLRADRMRDRGGPDSLHLLDPSTLADSSLYSLRSPSGRYERVPAGSSG